MASPQVFTTNDVIISSLFLIGELGTNETPDAYMLKTGLELINELLGKWSSDSIYIPYLDTLNFNFTVGRGIYNISEVLNSQPFTADPTSNNWLILSSTVNYPTGTAFTLNKDSPGGTLPVP